MSNPQSPAYREGIWEIREKTITALLPEGPWVLQVGDIEFIRLQSGTEHGTVFCDAFIKPRDSGRPYPVGRFASDKEGICKVLGQFADWNGVPLLDASGVQVARSDAPTALTKHRRQIIPFPKTPEYPLQTEQAPPPDHCSERKEPEQNDEPQQEFDPRQHIDPRQAMDPQESLDSQQGFDPRQGYNPQPGFDPRQTWWQWTFNPANPQFKKTIVILSVIAAVILILVASGVFKGLRMQSISGPGIVGIYFILRAMKNRKPKKGFDPNSPPQGSPWNQYAQQSEARRAENTDPASEPSSDSGQEAAQPSDAATPENNTQDNNSPENNSPESNSQDNNSPDNNSPDNTSPDNTSPDNTSPKT